MTQMRNKFSCAVIMLLGMFTGFQALGQSAEQPLLHKALILEQEGQGNQALGVYREIIHRDSQNELVLTHASVLMTRMADHETAHRLRLQEYQKAIGWARMAIRLNPDGYQSNLALAVALNGMGGVSGAKGKMDDWKQAKEYIDKAINIDPKKGKAYYACGKWYEEFANLDFAEKEAARLLFGGLPKASMQLAMQKYQTCINLSPGFLPAYLDLAKAFHEQGNDMRAIGLLKRALRLRPKGELDRQIQRECQVMLQNLQ